MKLIRLKDDVLINPEAIVSIYQAEDGITTICMRDGLDFDIRQGTPAHDVLDVIIAEATS